MTRNFPPTTKATRIEFHSDEETLAVVFDTRGAPPEIFRRELVEESNLLNAGHPVLLLGDGMQPGWAYGILVDEALAGVADGDCPLVAVYDCDLRAYVVVASYHDGIEPGDIFMAPKWCYGEEQDEKPGGTLARVPKSNIFVYPKVSRPC